MLRKSLLLICSLLINFLMIAQPAMDSLRKACGSKNDSLQIDAYLQLGKTFFTQFGNSDSLISNSKKALKLAESSGNQAQLYQSKRQIAVGYVSAGDTANAFPALAAALDQAKEMKDSTHMADVLHLYAALYGNLGLTDLSLSFLIQEADIAIAVQYYSATAIAYSSIAWVYRGKQQFEKVLFYHRKALALIDKMETSLLGNIIQVYATSSQGFLMAAQHYAEISVADSIRYKALIDSARILADSVYAIASRNNRLPPQASAYYVYAQCALLNKEFENAEVYALKALQLRDYIDQRTTMIMYTTIASANAHIKNSSKAIAYLDSASASPALSELYYRCQFAQASYEVYHELGNHELALQWHIAYTQRRDSLNDLESTRSINEIEQNFHKQENEREIQRLAQEQEITALNNKLLSAGIGGAILIALLIFLFYRQRNLKSEQDKLLVEQRLNRARMDPHFLFNTFTALQGLALKEKDPIKTAGFLSDYSVVMRQTLESTFQELTLIEDEVAYLEKYLSLQQMRMAGKFDFSIEVADDIDPAELMVPGMIIQPFIENSIEHAFVHIQQQGELKIQFAISGKELLITISDNGPGFTDVARDKAYPSRATGIIRDRLLLLNRKMKSNARYKIDSSATGVIVLIHLPLLK